ncbi:PREDICTED: uncharacterized protein LOC108577858 [Habropoda laboriosa]|uniref:uncharacterized protein LOC108577858 n=1 Tax=Habropoda laboriosa TaxID=597456 RepID=UPI00083D740D|nr:PREDICTED: uncharacterized protein LOC108577858 [Habropoda laboriosa]
MSPLIVRVFAGIAICGLVAKTEERRCSYITWEKINGVKPESVDSQILLFSGVNSNGITKPCFERCERANCTAFVVDFGRSVCYSVRVPEANSTFYHRVCVKVPVRCARERFWQVERNPGAVFIDFAAFHLSNPITRNQCYEKCVDTGRSCESAQFRTTRPLSSDDTVGRCSLSLYERGTRPRAYRASMYRDEYLQDQCRNLPKREYCSYAEFRNFSLPYSDVALTDLDQKQCERRCDLSVDGFVCRGYTLDNSSGELVCLLHSEDTNSLGVSSLIDMPHAIYREREPCLDLKVRCNESAMTIELRTSEAFVGRIYANGHADSCGVQGIGRNRTVLTLPVPTPDKVRDSQLRCGLNPAFSIDDRNRTKPLVWATIVVQFNPIVQRLGDQAVRVGCSLNDREPPQPRNVTVHSTFTFLDPNAGVPPISSTIVNASSHAPMLTMRILDENSRDAVVTHLGQKLTLKIQLNPPDAFAAFKFPDSQLVRFNVIVRFCLEKCTPANCKRGKPSYGKKKRASQSPSPPDDETPEVLPLQLSIIVKNPVASSADRLSSPRENSSPDTLLITGGPNSMNGLFCVDASLALSLLIFWLIIQIGLIVGCLMAIAQYRRTAVRAEQDRANVLARHLYGIHGGNFEIARRVRWADHNASSSSLG